MRASEMTIPSATGSAPPESPVPAPRATNGMPASLQMRTTACTSAGRRGQRDERRDDAAAREPVALVGAKLLGLANHVGRRGEPLDAARAPGPSPQPNIRRIGPVAIRAIPPLDWACPRGDLNELPDSAKRFADGAQYRVEIPSTEGPRCLEAVLEEAERLDVRVHRVSQGSGVFMQTDAELDEMARAWPRRRASRSRCSRGRTPRGGSRRRRAPTPASPRGAHGQEQVVANLEDCVRAAAHGFRSRPDRRHRRARRSSREATPAGVLPGDMQAKVSVMLPAANPAAARVLERLGASTINLPTDLTLPQIAAIRAAVDVPLDVYVEAPDNVGGFVRLHEIPELIRVAAPVYIKFGLRNAPDVYPAGSHLEATTVALSRERVRRARLGLELLARSGYEPTDLGARRCRARRSRPRPEGELMARPVTLFTGQWADLPLDELAAALRRLGLRRPRARLLGRPLRGRPGDRRQRRMRGAAASCSSGTASASGRSARTSSARRSATGSTSATARSCRRRSTATATRRACAAAPRSG